MSDLSSIEKLKLEKILGMGSGYVLDFSNRTFQEFITESVNINIYDEKYNYYSGSKANRLRAFWQQEPNLLTGQLLEKLLEYWQVQKLIEQQFISAVEQSLFDECQTIAKRLKGDFIVKDSSDSHLSNESSSLLQTKLLSEFDRFASLTSLEDRRARGFLLEDLLTRIFALHAIQVQKSFKRNEGGEQIDGAFKLDGWYYLVECKWTQKLSDIRQLDSLYGKVNRSGRQTLGLFLSINGWSKNVCPLLRQNSEKSIILMDGYDLRCVLVEHNRISLKDLLLQKLEHLNFEGEPFYSAFQLLQSTQ
ncbi:restriction endonuclease [Vacuolonema iberomarrocanum]|uniref:restriction endonuclease n=1 Tax=Vacuolonema iberomarrocanum TaxID=3454632 RepID=UPI001A09899C|nr:restriction endonuclease [filamentous cyanobacterium LEGE 07170]